jgi:hypothetical protein
MPVDIAVFLQLAGVGGMELKTKMQPVFSI